MKRIPIGSKVSAYNDAIEALRMLESDADEPGDKEAREWLADKLDKECDRWLASLKRAPDVTGDIPHHE
jgi:hypothetical protein